MPVQKFCYFVCAGSNFAHHAHHGCLAVPAQAILQNACELAVSVRDVRPFLAVGQGSDDIACTAQHPLLVLVHLITYTKYDFGSAAMPLIFSAALSAHAWADGVKHHAMFIAMCVICSISTVHSRLADVATHERASIGPLKSTHLEQTGWH